MKPHARKPTWENSWWGLSLLAAGAAVGVAFYGGLFLAVLAWLFH